MSVPRFHNCLPHQVRSLLASTEAYEADAGALQRVRKAGGYDADFSSGSSVVCMHVLTTAPSLPHRYDADLWRVRYRIEAGLLRHPAAVL